MAREAPAGNVAIIKSDEPHCLGQRTVHIRPNPELIDPDFLTYFLLAPRQQAALLKNQIGVHVGHVNMKDIRKLPLADLPPIKEQRKRAGIISSYDDLIENNKRRIELLEESARQLYKEWFVRFCFPGHEHVKIVDGVPEGWCKNRLGDVLTLNYGKALKADNRVSGEFPVYGSSGIVGSHNKALVKGASIVVGRKGNVGSVFWSHLDFHPIDTVYFVTPEQSSYFIYYALLHTAFINTDVAVPGLNRDLAYSREIIIPPEILRAEFEDAVTPIFEQTNVLEKLNIQLSHARDLLLPKLMSGEIAV
tara:strand:+ start:8474 stop:9391 length:918 start_codon:yes stop_codon:yes gene_type:complete